MFTTKETDGLRVCCNRCGTKMTYERERNLMSSVEYNLNFPHHKAEPTQEEFERLMTALSTHDLSVDELLEYLDEYSVFEACAYKTPLIWIDE